MAYTLIPGIQQDHKGRYFQIGVYPNGKAIQVPLDHKPKTVGKRDWTIPDDYQPKPAAESGFAEPRKTLAVIEFRDPADGQIKKLKGQAETIEQFAHLDLSPLWRFDGRRWLVAIPGADWHVQYFIPKE